MRDIKASSRVGPDSVVAAMPPFMFPPNLEAQPDELLSPIQISNDTTRERKRRKRPIAADDDESAGAGEASSWVEKISAIEGDIGRFNKHCKDAPVVLQLVQSTRPIDDPSLVITQSAYRDTRAAGGVGDNSRPSVQTLQARQEQREEHQAPRPHLLTLPSSLSTLESQIPGIFSPQPRTVDSQSVYSARSTTAGGKSCQDCVNLLESGYFSAWKNHYWPVHCPQEIYYCICKIGLKDVGQGNLVWQCKNCPVIFQDISAAVVHLLDRSLPCHKRDGIWMRPKPWKDHLHTHHISESDWGIFCDLCLDPIPDIIASKKKHDCKRFNAFRYSTSRTVYNHCEDHGVTLTTFDQVNEHYKVQHFKQAGPRSRRNRTNAGSTIGTEDSRHDAHSWDGIDPYLTTQQDHSCRMTNHATLAEPEMMFHQQSQDEKQPCNAVKDPAVDFREMGQKSTLQDLQYPQGDITVGDEPGPSVNKLQRLVSPVENSSGKEPPPLLANVVTEGGRAKFWKRMKR